MADKIINRAYRATVICGVFLAATHALGLWGQA